jgi:hypothetical protein
MFHPVRTVAAGVHLKEYTLREVTALLRQAGFARVATPLVVLPRRMVVCGNGLAGLKRAAEHGLEALPYALARLFCRGAALSTTIATKDVLPLQQTSVQADGHYGGLVPPYTCERA